MHNGYNRLKKIEKGDKEKNKLLKEKVKEMARKREDKLM